MFAYVIRRLLISIVVLFFATILVFVLVASSGNPLALSAGESAHPPLDDRPPGAAPPPQRPAVAALLDLAHRGAPRRPGHDHHGQDVASQAMSHLLVTLRMVIIATVIAIFVAIFVGVLAAVRQNKLTDKTITVTNFVLLATPVFVLGLALKEFVAIPINEHLNTIVFYTNGEQSPTLSGSFFSRLPDYAAHTALPVHHPHPGHLLVVGHLPALVDDRDAGRRPRAPGPGQGSELAAGPHPPRPAQRPHPGDHGDRPGLRRRARRGPPHRDRLRLAGPGQWYLQGVTNLDTNVMLAYLLITATFVILFNLLADILYGVLDPRIRYG